MSSLVLISGGTSGIGRAAAKRFIEANYTVIITGRSQASLDNAEKFILEEKKGGQLYKVILDLGDFESIRKSFETIKSFNLPSIDVIVHNAATLVGNFEQRCDGRVERTVFENAIAPLYFNRLLLPLLEKSKNPNKRILFISSVAHDPDVIIIPGMKRRDMIASVEINDFVGTKKDWNGAVFYALSKLAVVWNAFSLAEIYPSIPVLVACPGFIPTTDLYRDAPRYISVLSKYIVPLLQKTTTIDEAANSYLYYISDPKLNELSGNYFRYEKVCNSSKDAVNKEKRQKYWKFANDLIDDLLEQEK